MGIKIRPLPCVEPSWTSKTADSKSLTSMDPIVTETQKDQPTESGRSPLVVRQRSKKKSCRICKWLRTYGLAILAVCYFILVLPTGLLLCIWGIHRDNQPALAGGLTGIIVPALVAPSVYFGVRLSRQQRKDRRALYRVEV
ncbi:PREDICTED: uncharacterized protein LOC106813685 [Priapulus caudatus]|uniref:Uncharacterized protein LOC106813685 n=1 Tax=Priapulus caudatus TaxID=37621 RepID=A0ABM1EMF7_PRICU|nr:PREDICTED: uncharacterized protein LOC106813685 [Priapulus caudatus]